MSALKVLAATKEAGIAVEVDGEELVLRGPDFSSDIVDLLIANKPDLMRILNGRNAALATLKSAPPPGCWPSHWAVARRGLVSFMSEGWGDEAALVGWTKEELYQLPKTSWGRLDLTGAALLIGDRKVIEVTKTTITTKGLRGTELKFRRAGREHLP